MKQIQISERRGNRTPIEYANYVNNLPYPKKEIEILHHRIAIQNFHRTHFQENIHSHGVNKSFYEGMIASCNENILQHKQELQKLEEELQGI